MTVRLSLKVPARKRLALSVPTAHRLSMRSGAVRYIPADIEFEGPYEVTPTLDGFDVPTEGYYMADDMTVNPIPITETLNVSGGKTVLIG